MDGGWEYIEYLAVDSGKGVVLQLFVTLVSEHVQRSWVCIFLGAIHVTENRHDF